MTTTEKHYVIVSTLQRFRNWAQDNIKDEDWGLVGGARIHTPTKEYRAIRSVHHLRGATLTPETIHWTDDWYRGLTVRGAIEMERYVEIALAAGPIK